MQIQPPQTTPFDLLVVRDTFIRMNNCENLISILPDGLTIEYYYYVKAYKLVNESRFYHYCKLHKLDQAGNATQFMQMLLDILHFNYPPLEYGHTQTDGYIGLDAYVDVAQTIF